MTKKSSAGNKTDGKKKPVKKRRGPQAGVGYSEASVYFYYSEANGSVTKAMELAKAMQATDVPKDDATWYACVLRNGFAGKLAKEKEEYYKRYHLRREKKKQHMLDRVAASMEPIIEAFEEVTESVAAALKEKVIIDADGHKVDPMKALREVLSIEGFDRMFRMYLRAVGEPERITHTNHDVRATTIMTYEDVQKQKENAIQGQIVLTPDSAKEAVRIASSVILDGDEWGEGKRDTMTKDV